MKKNLLFALLMTSGFVNAQQESQFASSFQNPYIYNPAAGGMSSVAQVDLIARMQWVGYGGGPKTINFAAHSVVGSKASPAMEPYNQAGKFMHARPTVSTGKLKHVVGGKIMSDEIGVFNRVAISGSYAVHLPITKDFNFGVGIGLGWSNHSINQKRVVLYDQQDDSYTNALAGSQQHRFDANAGLVVYGKGLYFGASMTNALKNRAKFNGLETESFYNRHYYLNLAYGIKAGKITIEPGVIAKFTEYAPVNLDFGARFLYKNAMWLGVYGRTSNNMVFQFGTTLVENIYISYSYEHSVGRIRNAASGTHEIQLGIYIGKRVPKVKPQVEEPTPSTEGIQENTAPPAEEKE